MNWTTKKPTDPGIYLFDGKVFMGPLTIKGHVELPNSGLIDANADYLKKPAKKARRTK